MSTKSREVIWGSRIRGAQIRADGARSRGGLVDPDGGLRRPCPAIAYHRAMPQRRLRLAGGDVQEVRNQR